MPDQPAKISALISCYYEEQSIDEFYGRLSATLEQVGRSYEIIFVNDGSTDGTWQRLRKIYEADRKVTAVIDLYRNVGQAAAKTVALAVSTGDVYLLLDSDLQLDPEELPALLAAYDEGADVAIGYRQNRKDSWLRRLPSLFANMVMRRTAGHNLRDFGCTYKLYDAKLVRAFEFGPFKPWSPAFVISHARDIREIPVSHHPRRHGKSGWTMKRLTGFLFDNLVGVSRRPFQLLSMACIGFAAIIFLRLTVGWALPFTVLPRVTTGLILNALLLHLLVTVAILSAIGEYVIRNFVVLQRYPAYVIREIHQRQRAADGSDIDD